MLQTVHHKFSGPCRSMSRREQGPDPLKEAEEVLSEFLQQQVHQ